MSLTTDLSPSTNGKLRFNPFKDEDQAPIRRFIERMIGQGFAMIVVLGERPNGLEELSEWLHDECERIEAKLHTVNLGRFTFQNPLLELDHTIGKLAEAKKTILLLHGVDPRSELKRDDEVRLFRQFNVQRDSLTRDFPCFWVLYLPPRLELQLKTQAPDFCDYAGFWCGIRSSEQASQLPENRTTTISTTIPPSSSAFGQQDSLLEALGDRRLVIALTAIWDWKLEKARGLLAEYELSSNKLARPGALEFVQGAFHDQIGDKSEAKRLFACVSQQLRTAPNPRLQIEFLSAIGDHALSVGELDEALDSYRSASELAEQLGDEQSKVLMKGKIVIIFRQRGQTDEALKICIEEELPVYERLGNLRLKALTMGQIADILLQRGETDEALRIYREEQLPVFERLGDLRSKALTMGKIADILQQRGQIDEALRIYRNEQLPVFERLGDVRSKTLTMGRIAGILQQRGETEEALRIYRDDELPVYTKLGDLRLKSLTMGRIAEILQQSGKSEEALRIYIEEELPVFDRLGDIREKAVTMGRIADILQQRGQANEALRIRLEEELPIYEKVGDLRGQVITKWKIGLELAKSPDTLQRDEAREHLRWAFIEAEKQKYVFSEQFRRDFQRFFGVETFGNQS